MNINPFFWKSKNYAPQSRLMYHRITLLTLVITTLFFSVTAMAEEYRYAPKGCEFEITLPNEPYTAQRCNPKQPDKCHKITSFTEVFGLDATVSFNITCNPVTENMYERYNGAVMSTTLSGMARAHNLTEQETFFHHHEEKARQAILIGVGHSGASAMTYTTHLWVGHHSFFTVEAQLIGEIPPPEAHDMFAHTLRSIGLKKTADTGKTNKKEDTVKSTKKVKATAPTP